MDIETTGLNPWYGDRITCICGKDSDGKRFGMVHQDELNIINQFLNWVLIDRESEDIFLVTKNGKQFDIPFIMARFTLNCGLAPKDIELFLLIYDHFDLQEITRKRISLQAMAELLGCTPKSGTGMNAIKLWDEGRYDELKEYCAQDVDTTEEVFLKWKGLQTKQKNQHRKI